MRRFAIAVVLVCLLLCGCGSREKALVGSWSGTIILPASLTSNPMASMLLQNFDPKANLELKEDHTFVLSSSGTSTAGTWVYRDDKVILTVKTVGGKGLAEVKQNAQKIPGMPMDVIDAAFKPLEFTLSADSKEMSGTTAAGSVGSGSLKLKKQG